MAAAKAISCSARRRETAVAPPAAAGAAIRGPETGNATAAGARAPRSVGRPLGTKAAMTKKCKEMRRRKKQDTNQQKRRRAAGERR